MSFNGFLLGFLVSILPLIIMLRIFKGRFMFTEQPLLKGALMGFMLWMASVLIIMADAWWEIVGVMQKETGPALAGMVFASHAGFITAGIVLSLMLERVTKK